MHCYFIRSRVLVPAIASFAFLLTIASSGAPAAGSSGPYGEGGAVACYILNRTNMPGWTMLWKDSVARSQGCENVLPQCRDLKQRWGGEDVCCTLQNGDKKIYGKQAGSEACIEAQTPDYGAGSQVACYILNRTNMPGWTMLWKDSVDRSKGCDNVLPQCHDLKQRWGGEDVCCTLQNGDKTIYERQPGADACVAAQAPSYGEGSQVACYILNRTNMPGWTMLWKDSVDRSKGCDNVLSQCGDLKRRWGGEDVCCTLQNGDKTVTGRQPGTAACAP